MAVRTLHSDLLFLILAPHYDLPIIRQWSLIGEGGGDLPSVIEAFVKRHVRPERPLY